MIDIIAIIDNETDDKRITRAELNKEIYVTILNESYNKEKKDANKIKYEYGAKEVPFIVVNVDGKMHKVIYKEEFDDPIGKMVEIINDL